MKVLITGITGTAGQAFVRLLHPEHEIVGIDRNENRIAWMKYYYPDIRVQTGTFSDYRFDGDEEEIIHLAANKHIDQCEKYARQAIINNVINTHKFIDRAFDELEFDSFGVIYMSTDKACDPSSIYGYSKRLAEELVLGWNSNVGCSCMVVRSGNIYGSNGSVVPLWEEAIQKQKPIMLTDDSMKRYFITPEHLASQVWEVTQSKKCPTVFVPEMDLHITIGEILDKVLAKYGYTRENYPGGIIVTGLRVGEKMEESLHAERR